MAREVAPAYAHGGGTDAADLDEAVGAIERAVSRLDGLDLAAVDEPSLRAAMGRVHRQASRLQAQVARVAGQLTDRQAARHNPADPADARARQRAEQDTQRELTDRLHMTHSDAKRTVQAAPQLERFAPSAADAYRGGRMSTGHAALLARTLRDLAGVAEHDQLEARLVEAARNQDLTRFGRTCRRLTAEHAPDLAQRDLDRLKRRRYANYTQDADGMLHLRAGFAGIDAEIVATAIEVFRTPDAAGQPRTTDQRGADAMVAALRNGLEHQDSTEHGNRPHVHVVVDWATLTTDAGTVDTTFGGPLPASEIRRLLEDCSVSRIVTGPDSQVIDVGRATRTLPGPAWRGLLARDRGCTLDGCGAPPSRCQGAHLDRRWVQGAGVSVHEQALACWPCHDLIDRFGLTGRLEDGAIVWYRPDGTRYRRHPGLGADPPERP